MRRLTVLSMHTSPLAQPGTGDGGGMNVYVRELSAALARAGTECDVYTRAWAEDLPPTVDVEPGFVVHHVAAGPPCPVDKGQLHRYVEEFTENVASAIVASAAAGAAPEAIHANYWLSGLAGHELKHRFSLPLVSTFHTLDRVKAEASPEEFDPEDPDRRARAEASVIDCSDAVLASCEVEAEQLVELYGAKPSRVEIIPPGVDHAFFSPGDKAQARRALGLTGTGPLLLFVGRFQPLKGAALAVATLGALAALGLGEVRLVLVGGPSGPRGDEEVAAVRRLVAELGLAARVKLVPPQRHEVLSTYYRACDCCLVPSASESFGLVALEAAACGAPVVASAVGGLTSLVDHGDTGYLVEDRSPETFAAYAAKLLRDPDLAAALGAAAAERAAHYTWSTAAGDLLLLYDDLVENPRAEDC